MTVATISIIGLVTVLPAVQLRGVKGEYGVYLMVSAGFLIFFYGVSRLETILNTMEKVQGYIKTNNVYLGTLIKMVRITYIAEFASRVCKDAGYGSVGTQIEIFGKLSILTVSTPILLVLMETLQMFLS